MALFNDVKEDIRKLSSAEINDIFEDAKYIYRLKLEKERYILNSMYENQNKDKNHEVFVRSCGARLNSLSKSIDLIEETKAEDFADIMVIQFKDALTELMSDYLKAYIPNLKRAQTIGEGHKAYTWQKKALRTKEFYGLAIGIVNEIQLEMISEDLKDIVKPYLCQQVVLQKGEVVNNWKSLLDKVIKGKALIQLTQEDQTEQ